MFAVGIFLSMSVMNTMSIFFLACNILMFYLIHMHSRDATLPYVSWADKSSVRELILNGHDFQSWWQHIRWPANLCSPYI